MAQSLAANLTAFNKQIQTGMIEAAAEVYDLFNAKMQGAIVLQDGAILGNFPQYGFWLRRNTVARRDITSAAARTPAGHTMTEFKSVKLARAINDDQTVSALKTQGIDVNSFTRQMAQAIVEDVLLDSFGTAINGLVGTLTKAATTKSDISALSSANTISLNACWDAMQLLGDAAPSIKAIVMHSYQATALKKALAASSSIGQIIGAGVVMDDVLTGHFMRPVYISDNSTLKVNKTSASGAYDTYRTLFLTGESAKVTKMQTVEVMAYEDRAYDNVMLGITGEHELELTVKGFSYTNATANPTGASLATASNWTQVASSVKHAAGALLITR
jgi:hypothetical protein